MSVFFCCNHETLIPFLYLFDLKLLIDIIIIYIYIMIIWTQMGLLT